jgi:hypothetical protein
MQVSQLIPMSRDNAGLIACGAGRSRSEVSSTLVVQLPGVEPFHMRWTADRDAPEELAAWYDDTMHFFYQETQLFMLLIEDLARYQSKLF